MKKFVLTTKSHSGDDYHYLIQSPTKPTLNQLKEFLKDHGYERDEGISYEDVKNLFEVEDDGFKTI
jgi:hypothetical protein